MTEGQRYKILIVEDEEVPREIAKKALTLHLNVETFETDNGKEAVELFKQHQPDLVVQDIILKSPKSSMNGWDCIEEYRKLNNKIKVIVTSAYDVGYDLKLIKQNNISDIIQKPFDIEKFVASVKKVLEEGFSYSSTVTGSLTEIAPQVRDQIHKVSSQLINLKQKCEFYLIVHPVENVFDKNLFDNDLKSQKEAFKEALGILKDCMDEIDIAIKEVDNFKYLK